MLLAFLLEAGNENDVVFLPGLQVLWDLQPWYLAALGEVLGALTFQSSGFRISYGNHCPFQRFLLFLHSWKEAGWQIENFSLKGEWRAL